MIAPLAGLTVVAFEQAVAAPYCTSRLAQDGARVIKIERVEGDFARGYDDTVNGEASYFVWLNAGKESIALNLKGSADLELARSMVSKADVVVQNFARSIARSRNKSSMAASTATSRSCGTPSAGSSHSTMPSGSSRRTAT